MFCCSLHYCIGSPYRSKLPPCHPPINTRVQLRQFCLRFQAVNQVAYSNFKFAPTRGFCTMSSLRLIFVLLQQAVAFHRGKWSRGCWIMLGRVYEKVDIWIRRQRSRSHEAVARVKRPDGGIIVDPVGWSTLSFF